MTGNIPSSYDVKIGKNLVIENVEDEVNELSNYDFSEIVARVFDKINNGKARVHP